MIATRYLLIIAVVLCVFTLMAESYPELEKRGKKKSKSGKKKKGKSSKSSSSKSDSNSSSGNGLADLLVADVSNAVNHVVAGVFEGFATFYSPEAPDEGGKYGACHGVVESDKSNYVALSTDLYGDTSKNSQWCDRTVYIETEDGHSTTADIADACPTCKPKSLDLTPEVYNRIAKKEKGIVRIKWCVCGTKGCDADICK